MPDYQFIFVGGAPRSGTTLLQRILNTHPEIYGGPEFDDLSKIVGVWKEMRNIAEKRIGIYFNENELDRKTRRYIWELIAASPLSRSTKKIISEKTPSNIKAFDDLLLLFPDEKYIFMLRNPISVVNSLKRVKNRALELNLPVPNMAKNLHNRVQTVISHQVPGLIKFSKLSNKVLIVRHEDLINKPRKTIETICNHLNIQFEGFIRLKRTWLHAGL